ncbi:hypothetical protein CRYUN_Cryun22dG0033300 [Craigia yunnanensis]
MWVAPRQWSWPLNLPLDFFGIFRAKILKDEDLSTPWADEIEQKVVSSPEVGWERMVSQILFLGPSKLLEPNASFAQMSQKLIVSPIIKTLVFSKVPEMVRDWIDGIARDWKFERIIPAYFAGPIKAGRAELLAVFAFLDDFLGELYITWSSLYLLFTSLMGKAASYFLSDDMKTLSSFDEFLVSMGAVKKRSLAGNDDLHRLNV